MAKVVQRRRGTTAEHSSFVGLVGEITVNTSLKTAVVHDGTTAGGFSLARSDGSNLAAITGASLASNSIGIGQLNVTDGTAGQVLSTDGNAGQVLSTDGAGNLSFINVGIASLGISDGTNGQILQTNGAGVLSFVDRPADGADGADGSSGADGSGISLALAIAVG